jgi:hypothetical protein
MLFKLWGQQLIISVAETQLIHIKIRHLNFFLNEFNFCIVHSPFRKYLLRSLRWHFVWGILWVVFFVDECPKLALFKQKLLLNRLTLLNQLFLEFTLVLSLLKCSP